jgi:hypothetical protein
LSGGQRCADKALEFRKAAVVGRERVDILRLDVEQRALCVQAVEVGELAALEAELYRVVGAGGRGED